jgi:nitrous oxidase accessory protein
MGTDVQVIDGETFRISDFISMKVLLGLFLVILHLHCARASDIIVDPEGEIRTLTEAVLRAADGDRIYVKSGLYREGTIVIDKAVEIIGEGYPEFDGENQHEVIKVTSDNVTIRGIKVANVGVSFIDDKAAIKVEEVRGCVIEDNVFINNFFSIYLAKAADCRITNNDIRAFSERESFAGNGIHLWYSRDITIENNYVSGHRDGIYLEFVHYATITGNTGENNLRYGLHFMFSDNCVYTRNTFRRNGAGIAVMYTKNVVMTENRMEFNWGPASFGLLLKDINDTHVHNNVFYKNTLGIYSEGSNRVKIENNDFVENGWAVRIWASSSDNLFTRNNFINNTFDVATNSKQNFNMFTGNYWSNYNGYDLAGDGFGDVPYRPVRLFSYIVERYPASLILLHSLFISALDIAERIIPTLTPETLVDDNPVMRRIP